MSDVTAFEIVEAVYDRFDGIAPVEDGEIALNEIVLAVLQVLQQDGFIDLEVVETT